MPQLINNFVSFLYKNKCNTFAIFVSLTPNCRIFAEGSALDVMQGTKLFMKLKLSFPVNELGIRNCPLSLVIVNVSVNIPVICIHYYN
jgi:hypothetical protein